MDLLKVKNENDCEELATVDACDYDEAMSGWMTCLEEVLGDIETVKILGHEATLVGFDIEHDNAVVAVCRSGKKSVRVSLSSVEWPKLNKAQQIWLKAWNRQSGGCGNE